MSDDFRLLLLSRNDLCFLFIHDRLSEHLFKNKNKPKLRKPGQVHHC